MATKNKINTFYSGSIIFLALFCLSCNSKPNINKGVIYTEVENASNIKVPISFSADKSSLKAIREKHRNVPIFLDSIIQVAAKRIKRQLKYSLSFDLLKNDKGYLYVKNDTLVCLSFPFMCKNGYGNQVYCTAMCTGNEEPDLLCEH